MVTIDISALYTTIPHKDGIMALKGTLNNRQVQEPKTWIILTLMLFVLRNSTTSSTNKFLVQRWEPNVHQVTLYSSCHLEKKFLATQRLKPLIILWWPFIDDIFMIWPHPLEKLYSFLADLNYFQESNSPMI